MIHFSLTQAWKRKGLDRDVLANIYTFTECMERTLANFLGGVPDGSFPYIPASVEHFVKALRKIRKRGSFLEVGCGFGLKTWLAKCEGFKKAVGIDINKKYIDFCEKYAHPSMQVQCINALDYNEYDDFDVIYTYDPMTKGNAELYEKIQNEMKPGAYFLLCSGYPCDKLKLRQSTKNDRIRIYRKPKKIIMSRG